MTAAASRPVTGSRPVDAAAVLLVGTAAAVVEMVPILPIQAALGVPPARVLQAIASGLLGRAAFSGGAGTVVLGAALHWLICVLATLLFHVVAERWRVPDARPWLAGCALGVGAYAVMRYLVLPLSAVAYRPASEPRMVATSLAVHVLGFGLPVAFLDRALRRRRLSRGPRHAPAPA